MAVDIIPTSLDGTDLRIGIVVSRFNEYAGRGLYEACMDELRKLGVVDEDVTKVSVPGALEIPFALQKLATTEEYDALIALGAVIRGETYHFELVSNEAGAGISRVALDFDIPIANGVLTTNTDEQCQERLNIKGRDCAQCAVEMANLAKEFVTADDFESDDEDEEI
ncbi:6,7-dimethyl-8-ribityllumazine synthase [Sutterella sp.]|uniref:6,7-dimethyl-8-ribityllumazine synthase n=1 Tax=Sutterella sp. TaxID=1981025 RepID=UPI0026DF1618|nr:6,7-dimethyl-8-ribityllumazine synthase [Sutterella sp.]MDO5531864.1 6,7-dimethyl-8-ribityllumazine synthase [Sutterella sp.]